MIPDRVLGLGGLGGTGRLDGSSPTGVEFHRSASALPIVSLVFGILSFPLIIACFASLFTSLVAIATGHVALSQIKASSGQDSSGEAQAGRTPATLGLVLGYLCFAISIGLVAYFVRLEPNASTTASTPQERFHLAELAILSDRDRQIGYGNSVQAEVLAKLVSAKLRELVESSFAADDSSRSDPGVGQFQTYCELQTDSCAFLIHVPSYQEYQDESREVLSALAWTVAASESQGILQDGDRMAVALRGNMLYGDILIGTWSSHSDSDIPGKGTRQQELLSFFGASQEPRQGPIAEIESLEDGPQVVETPIVVQDESPPFEKPLSPKQGNGGRLASNAAGNSDAMPGMAGTTSLGVQGNSPARVERQTRESLERSQPTPSETQRQESVIEDQIAVRLERVIDSKGWNVQALAFINQDQWLVAGSIDSTFTVYDTSSGNKLFTSDRLAELSQVVALQQTVDDAKLLVGGESGLTAIMDFSQFGELENFTSLYRHSRHATALAASPKHPYVLSGGQNGTLAWQPYDGRSASPRILQSLEKQVLAVYLPQSGDTALATDGQHAIGFSLRTAEVAQRFELTRSYTHAAAYSLDGSAVAVSVGSEVLEFDTQSGRQVNSYKDAKLGIQWGIRFHPTEPWLLTGGRGIVSVWDRETGKRIGVIDTETILYVKTFEFSRDARFLAVTPNAAGQSIKIFQIGPNNTAD